jgi:RES domain-containing protein
VPSSRDLPRRLASFEAGRRRLRLWRGVEELRDPASTRATRIHGARWNPPGLDALYAAFETANIHAELARGAERRRLPEEARYPIMLVQIEVAAEVVDLTSAERLEDLGVAVPFSILTPTRESQRVGAAAAKLGLGGLIVPSVVARGNNVVLFPDNLPDPIKIVSKRRISSPGRWPKSS